MPSRCRALIISNWSCEMEEKSDMTDFWLQQERIALFRRLEKCEQPIMCLDRILPIQLIEKVGKVYKEQFEAHGCQFILGQKSWIYIRIVKGQLTQFFRRWNQTGLWSGECGRTLRSHNRTINGTVQLQHLIKRLIQREIEQKNSNYWYENSITNVKTADKIKS